MNPIQQKQTARYIGYQACQSLIEEAMTTPKPGLVDQNNNGSHTDMCLQTFLDSACALHPYFTRCAHMGMTFYTSEKTRGKDFLPILFNRLRPLGLEAEAIMYDVTKGVNTHKGAIFSLGLFCCALGVLITEQNCPPNKQGIRLPSHWIELSRLCREMTIHLLDDFKRTDLQNTHGLGLHRTQQIHGIRGEACAGYPSIFQIGYPVFRAYKKQGLHRQSAGACTLLHLICITEDTNIISRSGYDQLLRIQAQLHTFLCQASPDDILAVLPQIDTQFIQMNISPGGCADLLALIYFLDAIFQ